MQFDLQGKRKREEPRGSTLMYLFDTDVLSNVVKKNPSPYLLKRLKKVPSISNLENFLDTN